ncbi:hypothetical protein NGF19_16760 [Streptomyces sp. RY43-2]|uniref:Translation elongation factor EFG/EF2 domain-containing protein n=1 Tax=Streptomyces macrolidinus TaxID=2952607 RepID=A0ABT0ZFT4_9ACTN|nr:hypothetical protein [Streptomyces macrolidinus]MCN9242425.1 hypothetical protein [Streptomyces macrolidinus]
MHQEESFPPRPLRGVRAVYARQAGCPADFADITVDFEPWEEGIEFEVHADLRTRGFVAPGESAEYQKAVAAGVQEELTALEARTTVAVATVLRAVGIHEVDSRAGSFHHAGRLAVRQALVLAYGPLPRPKRHAKSGAARKRRPA